MSCLGIKLHNDVLMTCLFKVLKHLLYALAVFAYGVVIARNEQNRQLRRNGFVPKLRRHLLECGEQGFKAVCCKAEAAKVVVNILINFLLVS